MLSRQAVIIMDRVYISFSSRQDEAAGLVQLARHTRVDALPNRLYALRREDLKWLHAVGLSFRYASKDEVALATERVRHPAAAQV